MATSVSDADSANTFYALITGANDGLGFATCTRLISTFLISRPSSQRLYLLPTVRSTAKATDVHARLTAFVDALAAANSPILPVPRPDVVASSPAAAACPWPTTGAAAAAASTATTHAHSATSTSPSPAHPSPAARALFPGRVEVHPVQLDLCSLRSLRSATAALCADASVPRIDVVIANAGIGGWTGLHWGKMTVQFFTQGPIKVISEPTYKMCDVGALVARQGDTREKSADKANTDSKPKGEGKDEDTEPKLARVFCANVFGHYLLIHQLLPLLSRAEGQERGRVIWVSSLEAYAAAFDGTDLQGFRSDAAYESSKRLTDLLALTAAGPHNVSAREFFAPPPPPPTTTKKPTPSPTTTAPTKPVPPAMYVSHPGFVMTSIMPIGALMQAMQHALFVLARMLLGSQWHVVTREKGATAPVWLALEAEEVLAGVGAQERKWGSGVGRWGDERICETAVQGLGEERFVELGEKCWMEMEELRAEWERVLGGV